jgi:uncharacterized protein YegP (UPF0339 family)
MKFNINETSDNKYCFQLKDDSNNIVMASKKYNTKKSCKNGIAEFKQIVRDAEIVQE